MLPTLSIHSLLKMPSNGLLDYWHETNKILSMNAFELETLTATYFHIISSRTQPFKKENRKGGYLNRSHSH